MKKNILTISLSSVIIALVLGFALSPAFAIISNPSRQVSTAGFLTSPVGDADVVDTITASNYLLLAGGTLTGNLAGTNASMSITETTTIKATTASVSTGLFNVALQVPAFTTLATTRYIAYDTASASLKLYDGSNTVVVGKKDKCATIPYKDPTATDEFGHLGFHDPATITAIYLDYASGSNAVGWNVHYGRPNAVTTAVFAANKSASASANIVKYTTFGNSTPADGDVFELVITSASATIEEIAVTTCWRE